MPADYWVVVVSHYGIWHGKGQGESKPAAKSFPLHAMLRKWAGLCPAVRRWCGGCSCGRPAGIVSQGAVAWFSFSSVLLILLSVTGLHAALLGLASGLDKYKHHVFVYPLCKIQVIPKMQRRGWHSHIAVPSQSVTCRDQWEDTVWVPSSSHWCWERIGGMEGSCILIPPVRH